MSLFKPKKVMESPDYKLGICVWRLPSGGYIQDKNQNYLNCFGRIGDPLIENNMRNAALSLGVENGAPMWLPGFRRVTESEWEDQMATLLEGGTPDPVDLYRQANGH